MGGSIHGKEENQPSSSTKARCWVWPHHAILELMKGHNRSQWQYQNELVGPIEGRIECTWPKTTAAYLEHSATLVLCYNIAKSWQDFPWKKQHKSKIFADILSQDKKVPVKHPDFGHVQNCGKPFQSYWLHEMSFNIANLQIYRAVY